MNAGLVCLVGVRGYGCVCAQNNSHHLPKYHRVNMPLPFISAVPPHSLLSSARLGPEAGLRSVQSCKYHLDKVLLVNAQAHSCSVILMPHVPLAAILPFFLKDWWLSTGRGTVAVHWLIRPTRLKDWQAAGNGSNHRSSSFTSFSGNNRLDRLTE